MSSQSTSKSIKNVPSTSGSSNQQGKTQVFILSPDVLKKLGIANKIPNFPLASTTGKASNSKTTAQVIKDVNLGENMKNKLNSVLNKKNNDSREPKNETKKCDKIVPGTKCDENSVKSKLLSMLSSKSEKEKEKNTSCSVHTIKETHTSNLENQIKPNENTTSNLKETKLLHNFNVEEKSVTKIDKPEIDLKINESSKHDNETETIANRIPVLKINKPIKNTKEISETKHPVQSTNFRSENENCFSDLKNVEINNSVILNENKDNKTCSIDAAKHSVGSTVKTNEQEKTTNVQLAEKTPRRGRKRKIIEENPHEDSESISSVRKSVRKRKLSTLLSDYVMELKLPDESSQKISNKSRKSTDSQNIDTSNRSIIKDCNDSNKNDTVTSEHNESQTENETGKLTKVPEIISSTKITSANTIISKPVSISKNTAKEIESKIPFLQLSAPSSSSICNKSVFTSKNILQSHLKNKISNVVTDEVAQKTQSVADKVSNEIIPDMVKEKSNKISEQKEIYQEIKIKQNTPVTSVENVKVLSNQNESNNVGQSLVTYLDVGTSKINIELTNQTNPNIPSSSKKQIIIHENILIKPSNENYLNNEAEQPENTAISTEKLSVDKDIDSSLKSENIAVLTKRDTVNDAPINLKMKSLKTYPGKVRKILSTNAELCSKYTDRQSLSNSEPNLIEKLSSDKHVHSLFQTDNTKVIIKEDDVNDSSTDITFKVKTPFKTYPGKIKGRLSTDAKPRAVHIGGQNSVDTEPNQNELKSATCIPVENISSETIVTKISDSAIKTEVHTNIKEKQNTEICSPLNIKPNELKITTCTPVSNEKVSKEALAKKINSLVKIDASENIEEKENTEICVPLNYKENKLKPVAYTPELNKNILEEAVVKEIHSSVKSTSENVEEKQSSEICAPLNYKTNELKVSTYTPEPNKNISEEAVVRKINSPNKLESSENIGEKQNNEICSLLTNNSNELKVTAYTPELNKNILEEAVVKKINSSVKSTSENIEGKQSSEICAPLNYKTNELKVSTYTPEPNKNISEEAVVRKINSPNKLESSENIGEKQNTEICSLLTNKSNELKVTAYTPELNKNILEEAVVKEINSSVKSTSENIEEKQCSEICAPLNYKTNELKVSTYTPEPNKNISEEAVVRKINSPNKLESSENIGEKQNTDICSLLTNKSNELTVTAYTPEPNKTISEEAVVGEINTSFKIETSENIEEKPNSEICSPLNNKAIKLKVLQSFNKSATDIVGSSPKETKNLPNTNISVGRRWSRSEKDDSAYNNIDSQIENLQSSVNLSEVGLDSSITVESKTNQNIQELTTKQDRLTYSETTTGNQRSPKQTENIQEPEVNISEPEICNSLTATETKTRVNVYQKELTDSETPTLLKTPNQRERKPPKQIKNIQESEVNNSEETFDSPITTETKSSVNVNQELLTDSETPTLLTTLVRKQRKPSKQIENVQESEINITEPEICDSSISTETKPNVIKNQEILTVSESSTLLSMIVPEQSKTQIQNVQESKVNISEPETCDSSISYETKTNVNINHEILTDTESTTISPVIVPEQSQPPKQLQNVQESEVNISEPETCDSPITSDINTSENVNQAVLTDSETITPLKTPNRRQRKPPKQIKNIQESEDSNFEPETFDSSIATEIKTSVNVNQELLTDSETSTLLTTPVQMQRKPPQQIRNIQESEVGTSKPETCNSQTATEPNTSVTVKQEVNAVSDTPTYLQVPTRRKGRPPKKKIEESANLSEPETCNSPTATETKTSVNVKQEVIEVSETLTYLQVPTRRKGRPPKKKIEESANLSESETCNSPTATEPNNSVTVKQEIIAVSETPTYLQVPIRRKGRPPKKKIEESAILSEPETCNSPTATETKTSVNVKQEVIAVSETPTYLQVPIRRKGRPPKKKIEESTSLSESETLDSSTVKEELEVTPVRRGRGRGKQEVEENSTPGELIYKKNPGKGRKRNLNEMETNEDPWKFKDGICAVCNETVTSSNWTKHSMTHNFLCWRIGEAAIDMKDKRVLEYVLTKGLKENSKTFKHFICPQCDDKKKSVLGFIAHMEICQLTEEERIGIMVSCTICDKKVMPQSMKSHMKIHEYTTPKNVEVVKTSLEINVNEDTPRTKRKAATKAVNLIQEVTNHENVPVKKDTGGKRYYKQVKNSIVSTFINFGVIKKIQSEFNKGSNKCKYCDFKTDLFDEYKTHLNSCPALNPDDYICRYCLFVNKDESIMKEHVKCKHIDKDNFKAVVLGSESDDDDAIGDNEINSEEEILNPNKPKRIYRPPTDYIKPAHRVGFLAKERRIVRNPVCSFLPALRWTREFIRENYSKHLFENIKCLASKWTSVSLSEQEKYMPRWKKSMSVKACSITYKFPKLQNIEHMWKEYDLLETDLEDDTATIFCGGPIWGLAWVPTPINTIYDQYLAVSVQKDFEATYKISETSTGHELIQIWNFGPIESKVTLKSTPTLEFSIAHNHGMVWCMEWCPSGFYDTTNPTDSKELRRLGLLALACSDGNIPIYAIGIPHKDKKKIHNIFNVKPVIKLVLQEPMEQLLGQWKYQATKLSWSKSSGHNIIAGGYSNGVVCLWDLENTSPLLRSEENGVIILKPYHSFQAHSTAISALVLYPLIDKGKRWLLTGSWDRTLKYWDVNNTTTPISAYGKRGMITDGVWITHWLCTFSSFDDVFSLGHTVTTVQNPRDFGFRQCSALASNSFVMALSANDWASAVAQGTLAGELTTTFPRAILISYDVDKYLKCKRMMLSYSEIIDKTKNVSERKDIMISKNNSNQSDNEKDEKLFSRFLNDNDKNEPYVEQPSTYEEAREKFGMLFCDFKLGQFNYIPEESLKMVKQSSRLREVPTEMYPFTSLNRVAWNPNRQAHLYVACGYQNGFVRLRCIRFMNTKISDT